MHAELEARATAPPHRRTGHGFDLTALVFPFQALLYEP
jgi:hypothetical protein